MKNAYAAKTLLRLGTLCVLLASIFLLTHSAVAQERTPTLVPRPAFSTQNATSEEVADALGLDPANVTVDFGASDPEAYEALATPAAGFPVEGNSYLVLSSGLSSSALEPNNEGSLSTMLDGLTTPGPAGGNDLTRMALTIDVADEAESVSFDFKFLSEEFPEFVGTEFNDGFVVEVGSSMLTIEDTDGDGIPNIVAPGNVVFDEAGDPITINTTGDFSFTEGNAVGTTYDGASPTLTTTVPIPDGTSSITLVFSVFDAGDNAYDSAVFVGDLNVVGGDGDGGTGVADNTPPECSGSLDGDTFFGTAADTQGDDGNNTGIFAVELSGESDNLVLDITSPDPFEEGTEVVEYEVTQDDSSQPGSGSVVATDGDGNTCSIAVNIEQGSTDTTPPVCGEISIEENAAGDLVAVETSSTDPESGIASVAFTTLDNLEGFAGGAGPYQQGDVYSTSDPNPSTIEIRGERISFEEGGVILTQVTNGAGLSAQCDPATEQIDSTPAQFALRGNYPNPFGEATTIEFSLPEVAAVTLEVYDVLGRKVATLVDGERLPPGTHRVEWNVGDVASGTYVYHIEAGEFAETRRMVLVK